MKNSIIAISDVHFNLNNLEPASLTLRQSLEEARKRNCDLFIGGDLNDQKAILRAEAVEIIIKLFQEFSDVSIFVLIGNHDLRNNNAEGHSLEFLSLLENVSVISKPITIGKFSFIPYIHSVEKFKEALNQADGEYLFMHQGVRGANLSDYLVDDFSIDASSFGKFKRVFTGHYHSHQTVLNVEYWGSPYTVDFSEADQKKYIHFVSVENGLVHEMIETNVRRHYQYEFSDVKPTVSTVMRVNKEDLVKVILKGDKHYIASISKEHLKELLGVDKLVVVPMITRTSRVRMEITRASKPIDVMLSFLESAETTLDKTKLKEYIVGATQ